jgi:hypothetical protein
MKYEHKKWIPLILVFFSILGGGLYLCWPFFIPIPTPEQAIRQIKDEEEERLKKEEDEDAMLLASNSLPNLTVSEIARIPNRYDKRLVRLRGCVLSGFETFVLMECTLTPGNIDNRIWLESSMGFILFTEKITENRQHWRTPLPQTKSQAAMLQSLLRTEHKSIPATIEGEFQSSEGHYGHLGSCKYRLIVHRIIEIASQKEDSK